MDYKKNYLKYKNKYLNLKKIIGGTYGPEDIPEPVDTTESTLTQEQLENLSDENIAFLPDNHFLKRLKKVYSTVKFDSIDQKEKYPNNIITYGEMNYEGMHMIIHHLHTAHEISFKNFIDFGSGRGKLPLQVASYPNVKKSIGIEIVKERHDDAEEIKDKLKKFDYIVKKVNFINRDFKDIILEDITDVTLVWISNKCFPQELTDQIFSKLITLPKGSVITCSNEVSNINTNKIKKIDNLKVPMSWYPKSDVYFYIIE
jgi:hypothetical protein